MIFWTKHFVLEYYLYLCEQSVKTNNGNSSNGGIKEMEASSYRPRNAGHDYYGRGIYLNTLAAEICTFDGEAKIRR